jgi:pimeloyl-ACP methyl ester carboxylesterase
MGNPDHQGSYLKVGLGAGLLGALFIAMKYAIRRPTKLPVPDSISPAVFKTKVLHTSLGQIVYHESGAGQPLVFIHHISPGGSSYEWSKVYPEFVGEHRVIAPDLIGFGESARPNTHMTAADQVRALAEFLRATSDEPAVLVASGIGAGLSVYLASQHPELVSRLILLMPTGLTEFGRSHLAFSMRAVSAFPMLHRFIYRNYQSTHSAIRAWLAAFGFADPGRITDETVDVFTTCAQQYGAEHSLLSLHAGRFAFDLESRMKQLAVPVAILWADHPDAPPLDWAYRLQILVKNSSVTVLRNVRALAALEDPGQMIEVLHDQLGRDLRIYKAS